MRTFKRGHACCCCGERLIGIRHTSTILTSFDWTVPARRDTSPLGKGAHFCVGAALARLEATIVLGQLLERTSKVMAADVGKWLPSLLVRRLEHLLLGYE